MQDISSIPTDELLQDLRDSATDADACLVAMGFGVNTYTDDNGESCSVKSRYEGNKQIITMIENELNRREITFARVQP